MDPDQIRQPMSYNSTIRQKTGVCELCNDGKTKPLTKGMCNNHYWLQVRLKSATKEKPGQIEADLQELIKDADSMFSAYVRLSAADENGNVKCFTCPNVGRWQDVQAGHYIGRACIYLRWDLRNVKPQCKPCNEFKRGNLFEYTRRLDEQNPGITGILIEEARIVTNITRDEVRQIINEYSEKVKALKASQ